MLVLIVGEVVGKVSRVPTIELSRLQHKLRYRRLKLRSLIDTHISTCKVPMALLKHCLTQFLVLNPFSRSVGSDSQRISWQNDVNAISNIEIGKSNFS